MWRGVVSMLCNTSISAAFILDLTRLTLTNTSYARIDVGLFPKQYNSISTLLLNPKVAHDGLLLVSYCFLCRASSLIRLQGHRWTGLKAFLLMFPYLRLALNDYGAPGRVTLQMTNKTISSFTNYFHEATLIFHSS